MKGLAAAFIELLQATAKYDKRLEIHENGVGNNYPALVESRIANSVTAKRCAETMATYLTGKGFGDELNKLIVHEKKNITLLQFLQDISESIAEQNGVFIAVNYEGIHKHSSFEVIPFGHCRIGKKDDDNYTGKILVCTDWSDQKKAKKARIVDVYNDDPKVVEAQVKKAGSFKKYNGQILYVKFGKYIYPYSRAHPVLDDADSERAASVYKNSSLRKGFFGKTLIVTKPLVDPTLNEEDDDYKVQVTARTKFRETIQSFIGAENVDGALHLEMEFESDDIDKEILFKNIDTNINDKLFAHTETSVSENICVSYGINPNLIKPKDAGLFAQSGESYKQMKLDYQEETSDERLIVEQIVNKLMKKFTTPKEDLKIIPRIPIPTTNGTDNQNGNS
ncbi:hypothetical protein [Xanthomarina gelatinilytica]|uniref:hypothetical protein n=1 Tax=Xanthomarina gelatinilytica TaxID=1137281 RepID=UPI003AA85CD4